MKADLHIEVKNPKYVMQSLLPDIDNSKDIKIKLAAKEGKIIIKIEAEKISHLKAAINSYLSLINVIKEME